MKNNELVEKPVSNFSVYTGSPYEARIWKRHVQRILLHDDQSQNSPVGTWAIVTEDLIHLRHEEACETESITYIDPETGLHVFTEYYLANRGFCCRSECRHCPYGDDQRSGMIPRDLIRVNRSRTLAKNWKRDRR